jgi:zinc protease
MKFRKLFILLMVFCFTAVQAQPGMGDQVIPNDTAVRIGKLANGLTYYIRHNNWPEHRANFYIPKR